MNVLRAFGSARRVRVWEWLAWKLPRELVYFCVIRVFAHATTGYFGNTVAPSVMLIDALDRWALCNRCGAPHSHIVCRGESSPMPGKKGPGLA